MNPSLRARNRVSLPTGKTGTIRRILKNGFLDILCDNGEDVIISPNYATKIDGPEPAEPPREIDPMRIMLAQLNLEITQINTELLPYRRELRALTQRMSPLRTTRKALLKKKKELIERSRRTTARREQRKTWHREHAAESA